MPQRKYVVVGGSSGIGLALVRRLSEAGDAVTVLSRTGDALAGMPHVTHHAVDVTKEDLSGVPLPEVIDGVVYAPGSITLKPFRSLKPEAFRSDFEINVVGAVQVLQAAYPALRKSDAAGVVFFSTVAVGQGMPYHASVAAAKGAIEGLTRALAAEWAPGIRVNCIAPSLTDTPMAARLLSTPAKREAAEQRHPLRRVGDPDQMAHLAQFLLGPAGGWITGQVIGVDGGLSTLRP